MKRKAYIIFLYILSFEKNDKKNSLDFALVNKSLPWDYDFRFVIEEINNINDKAQVKLLSSYKS